MEIGTVGKGTEEEGQEKGEGIKGLEGQGVERLG
jgi:hypothetical protein